MPEIVRHTWHLVAGSTVVDFIFVPGETIENTIVGSREKFDDERKKLSDAEVNSRKSINPARRLHLWVCSLYNLATSGTSYEGPDRPNVQHFDTGERGLTLLG